MTVDYRQFKTPFYEVQIGDPSWKRKVKLPDHILRLVDKIEITENFFISEVNQEPSMLTIVFIEGSREPASPDHKLGTAGLYQIASDNPLNEKSVDMNVAGSLTNRPGIITDLRFSGSGGITWLTEYEKKTGKVDRRPQKNVQGKTVTRKHKAENNAPTFLFHERNKIKVTWGYKEDPKSVRSAMFSIIAMHTDFPENGQPTTTITANCTRVLADQIATKNGVPFGTIKRLSKDGDSLIVYEDLKTDQMLRDICQKAGMAHIISTNLPADKTDKDKQKMWIAGESLDQFLTRLANLHGCIYTIRPDRNTGIDTLIFIKKQDFEKRLILSDKELLYWKAPGSILKKINILADFGHITGAEKKGTDDEGDTQSNDTVSNEILFKKQQGKTEKPAAADPTGNNPNPTMKAISEKVANGGTTGKVDNTPIKSKGTLTDRSQIEANNRNRLITMEMATIGYTRLTPGVVEINGIGIRYSGKYRIYRVTHTLDSQGYITTATGTSHTIGSGGVTPLPDTPKGQEDKMSNEQLFKKRNQTSNEPLDRLQKFLGTA